MVCELDGPMPTLMISKALMDSTMKASEGLTSVRVNDRVNGEW